VRSDPAGRWSSDLEVVDQPGRAQAGDALVVLGAARLGKTRLIDNFEV